MWITAWLGGGGHPHLFRHSRKQRNSGLPSQSLQPVAQLLEQTAAPPNEGDAPIGQTKRSYARRWKHFINWYIEIAAEKILQHDGERRTRPKFSGTCGTTEDRFSHNSQKRLTSLGSTEAWRTGGRLCDVRDRMTRKPTSSRPRPSKTSNTPITASCRQPCHWVRFLKGDDKRQSRAAWMFHHPSYSPWS